MLEIKTQLVSNFFLNTLGEVRFEYLLRQSIDEFFIASYQGVVLFIETACNVVFSQFLSLVVVGCSLLLSKARHCVIARIRRLVIARTAYQVGTANAVAQNVPVNCAEVRRFPSHNRKGVDVHSGIPLIRIAITMAYAARAVHLCARFLYWQLPAVAIYWKPLISLAVK
ncbi:hypothetical protein EcoM_04131 [Escherichia coli WV_060327]|nr:hypothetical protein EcoM_04131 [Escherichia coli WV_060327]